MGLSPGAYRQGLISRSLSPGAYLPGPISWTELRSVRSGTFSAYSRDDLSPTGLNRDAHANSGFDSSARSVETPIPGRCFEDYEAEHFLAFSRDNLYPADP